jgi:hypothetical protein
MGCWSNLVRHLVCTQEIGVQLPGGPLSFAAGGWRAVLHRPWEPGDVGSNPTPLTDGLVVQREDAGLACRRCGFDSRRVHCNNGGQPDIGWPGRSATAVLLSRGGGFNSLAFRSLRIGDCRLKIAQSAIAILGCPRGVPERMRLFESQGPGSIPGGDTRRWSQTARQPAATRSKWVRFPPASLLSGRPPAERGG